MKEVREALLLPDFSAHNLRHTFCTRFCENETNLKVIQDIMGHADISTMLCVCRSLSGHEAAIMDYCHVHMYEFFGGVARILVSDLFIY